MMDKWLGWAVIVAALVMIGVGFYLTLQDELRDNQRNQELECLGEWASQFGRAVDDRVVARDNVEQARRDREDAVDDILLLFRNNGENVDENEFRQRISNFADANQALDAARRNVERTQAQSPYPPPPAECFQ